MKKILYLASFLLSNLAFAQVKIGDHPTNLGASSLLELESSNRSLLISRVADTNAITAPVNGMIIYDLSAKCFKGYQDGAWTNCGFVAIQKSNAVLTQIGNEGDSPNMVPSVVTATQLTSIGITGVTSANEAAYQKYIDANPSLFSSPATMAEVQAMVTAVNTNVSSVLTQIGNEGDSPNTVPSVVTVTQLTSLGVTGLVSTNEKAYQAYIDANPSLFSSPATMAEVQAMVTAVNTNVSSVLTQIGNEGDSPNTVPSVITVAQISSLGVTCVVATSQAQYRSYIDLNPNSFSSPATIAEVQTMTNALAAQAPAILNCGSAASITSGASESTTATGGDGGTITWSISPTTGVSTASGTGLSTGAITFTTAGIYTLTYTSTKVPPVGCGTTTTTICTKTITVSVPFTLSNTGFESATSCSTNFTISGFNAAFSDNAYKGYLSPASTGASIFQVDIYGTCASSYGNAWSGNRYIGLAYGDAFTIDLGADLVPGTTFTMTMYQRKDPSYNATSYRVGISKTAGTTGGSGFNNLFSVTGSGVTTTWSPVTITFTVPSNTTAGYRYLTIENTASIATTWIFLDF